MTSTTMPDIAGAARESKALANAWLRPRSLLQSPLARLRAPRRRLDHQRRPRSDLDVVVGGMGRERYRSQGAPLSMVVAAIWRWPGRGCSATASTTAALSYRICLATAPIESASAGACRSQARQAYPSIPALQTRKVAADDFHFLRHPSSPITRRGRWRRVEVRAAGGRYGTVHQSNCEAGIP
jgi:hypothetical protein